MIYRRFHGFGAGLAALSLASATMAAGNLVWASQEAALQLSSGTKTAVAEYSFRNAGPKTVRILSVAPSCDCVTAKADRAAYAPGESGTIRAEFTVGGSEGHNEKSVNVVTDDDPAHPQRLLLTVDLPEPVALRPRAVFWKTGEPAAEKAVEIVLAEPAKAALGDVQCAEATFAARVEPLTERGHYRVQIKPAATDRLAQATIRLNATVEGQSRVYVIYAVVK